MQKRRTNMSKNWYKVRSPEGYIAMERAYSEKEACRAEIYITESERRACRAGLEATRERMGNR